MKDDIVEVLPSAVRTATKTYPADVIILATGFQTQKFLNDLQIRGRNGELLSDHWKQMGGPGAYHTTAVTGCKPALLVFIFLTDWHIYGSPKLFPAIRSKLQYRPLERDYDDGEYGELRAQSSCACSGRECV